MIPSISLVYTLAGDITSVLEEYLQINMKKTLYLFFGFLVLMIACIWYMGSRETLIEIKVAHSETPDVFQLYISTENQDYSEKEVINLKKLPNEPIYVGAFKSQLFNRVNSVRIDPAKTPGDYSLSYIELNGPAESTIFNARELASLSSNQVLLRDVTDRKIAYTANGADPYFILRVPNTVQREGAKIFLKATLGFAIILVACIFIAFVVIPRLWHRIGLLMVKALDLASDVSHSISDSRVVVIKPLLVIILTLIPILAALFIFLKLHQSSIGVWDHMFGESTQNYFVNLGTYKRIRSDEWNTQTPWILNQSQLGFEAQNRNIGGARSAFVAYTPTMFWTSLLQPKFWGLYLLDLERGFSWIWAYKLFGLIASFLLLFAIIGRGSVMLALFGTTWVVGSSFVQWWFSSGVPEILIGFAVAVTGAVYLLLAQRRNVIIAGGVLIAFGLTTLLFHIYPAFVVPLAFLGAVIVVGVFVSNSGSELFVYMWRTRCITGVVCVLFSSYFFASWYVFALDTINLMSQTVYPGSRFNLGGTMPLDRLWYGFFESLRFNEDEVPLPPSNASEASSFLMIFPLLLLFVRPRALLLRENRIILLLFTYCVFVIAWAALPLPEFLRYFISMLGWSQSSPERSIIALGIGSILLTVSITSMTRSDFQVYSWHYRLLVLILIACGVSLFGISLSAQDPIFFAAWRILIAVVIVLLLLISLVHKRLLIALFAVFLSTIPAFSVNPLQSGLASIQNKPILNLAKSTSDSSDRWLVVGSFVFAQGLKARGLDVLNGSNFAPDFEKMAILDSGNNHLNVWNRYAHISVESDPAVTDPVFVLLGADHYLIKINFCNKELLDRLKVTKVAYTVAPASTDRECLNHLLTDASSGVSIFSIK